MNADDLLHVREIPGAMNYRFEVSDGVTTWLYTRPGSFADCRLSNVSSAITFGKTYSVKVGVSYDGTTWGAYGSACSVTVLPKIKPAYCGQIQSLNSNHWMGIYPVTGAVNYRYKVIGRGKILYHTRGSSDVGFNLDWVYGTEFETAYTIQVAYSLDGTTWSAYGETCTVTTPPLTKITNFYCAASYTDIAQVKGIVTIPGATKYRYELVNGGTTLTHIKDASSFNGLVLKWVPGIQNNTTYQVRVAYSVDGTNFSPYGTACALTTPSSAISKQDSDFEIFVAASLETYPNPNNGDFTISSTHEGTFNIINELGQLIQTVEITKENNYQTKVENLSKGIYFVTGIVNNEVVMKKIIVQ